MAGHIGKRRQSLRLCNMHGRQSYDLHQKDLRLLRNRVLIHCERDAKSHIKRAIKAVLAHGGNHRNDPQFSPGFFISRYRYAALQSDRRSIQKSSVESTPPQYEFMFAQNVLDHSDGPGPSI
jgi:hypothetical protein